VVAALSINAVSAYTVINEGFEGTFPPDGWKVYKLGDQSSQGWQQGSTEGLGPHNGNYMAWHDDEFATCDDWLVTPQFTVPANGVLKFWEYNFWMGWYQYHGVWISTGSGDPNDGDFVELQEFDQSVDDWTQRTIDLSSYAGQKVYIAFRYKGDWATEWYIDDVVVEGSGTPPQPIPEFPAIAIPAMIAMGILFLKRKY